jgi:hypothetical protein
MRVANGVVTASVFFSALFLLPLNVIVAQTAESKVKAALEELDSWVGEGEQGGAWRRFLKSDQLLEELGKGDQAERKTVCEIRDAYSGLELRRFVAVREALEAWLRELPLVKLERLPQTAREAQSDFKPATDDDVKRLEKNLADAIGKLDRFLTSGSERNAKKWKDYLRWTDMEEQLKREDGPDWKSLHAVALKYYDNKVGLEHPKFMAVRTALRDYADAVLFSSNPKAQQYYEQYLEEMARLLESQAESPTPENAIVIGKRLGWLERFGQAEGLVAAVRQHYSRPNLLVQLSEDMMKTGFDTDVDERLQVQEVILGTSIRGDAQMKGRVTLDLVPDSEKASFDIVLSGTTTSENVGHNGPVTIYSSSVTSVDARKRVLVDATGIANEPARADCRVRSKPHKISGSAFAQSVAWSRVGQQKARAEAIASQRAERRAEKKVDQEVGELLELPNDLFIDNFRNPLLRRDAFPQVLKFSTTEDTFSITALASGSDQLAAPSEPPAFTTNHDVGIRLHQSFIANLSQAVLGGVTLTDERLVEVVERLTGSVPDDLVITDEDDPWSITFASERPLEARFDDQSATVFIRGKRFTRGDTELKKSIQISATYKIAKTPKGAKLERQEDVTVEFLGGKRLSASHVAMKTFMKKRFEAVFKREIVSDGIELPGRWQQAGKMRLQQLHCDDGWLALGWHQPPRGVRTAKKD